MDSKTNIKIDSSGARADLAALAKSLDNVGTSAAKMQSGLAKGVEKSNAALQQGARSMEKFAQVAAAVSKIKISGDPAKQITEFANALNTLGKAKSFDDAKLKNLKEFIRVLPTLKVPAGARRMTEFLNAVGAARAPSASTITRLNDFITTVSRYKANAAGRQGAGLAQFFTTLSMMRAPSASSIARLEQMFRVLESAKPLPNANAIARDLDHVAAAATRASRALGAMPSSGRGKIAPAFAEGANAAGRFNREINQTPQATSRAQRGVSALGVAVGSLTGRFNLAYQAGSVFSAMFSAFTLGQFIKGIYDASIAMMKLEKAMLFVTGSFAGAKQASAEYLGIADELGMRALANAEAYSRFAISSAAIGASQKDVNNIFRSTTMALTAIGASTQQTEYAFYGLSQAMAKGKVTSEEFNRQIGEQIPGNVAAGVKALSRMRGQSVSTQEFFDEMRKGAIQSLPFFKLWAEEIDKMFAPLLPSARERPDFQLNRIINAFDRFKVATGNAGFIGELTTQFKRLADIFVEGEGAGSKLTGTGQKLADSFGKGLADVVRGLGDAIAFAAEHIDEIVGGLKALLVLGVGSTFMSWAKAAAVYANNMRAGAAASMLAFRSMGAAKGASTAAATTAAPATMAGLMGARGPARSVAGASQYSTKGTQSYADLRARGYSHTDAGFYGAGGQRSRDDFWKRGDVSSRSPTGVATFGRRAPYVAPPLDLTTPARAAAGNPMAGAGAAAMKGFGVLRGALNLLPGLAIAAAVALALFGNRIAGVGEVANATFNDVAGGILNVVGDIIGGGLTDLLNGLTSIGKAVSSGEKGKGLGDWFIDLAAVLITVGKIVFTVASTVGKLIGTMLSHLVTLGAALGMAATGNFKGAGDMIKATVDNQMALFKEVGDDWKNALDFTGLRDNIVKAVAEGTNKRINGDDASRKASEAAEAGRLQVEAALQQRMAADANARAAADMQDATSRFKELTAPLSYQDIRADIVSLMDGSYARENGKRVAAATAAAAAPATGRTYASVEAAQRVAAGGKVVPAGTAMNIYNSALGFKGLREDNDKDKKSLRGLFGFGGASNNIDPEKVKWCAAFVNAVLGQNGMKGTGSLWAEDFNKWGEATAKPEKGDVVVLKNHVGFFDSFNKDGSVNVLGGNQGDKVGVDKFAANKVLGYRRATDIGPSTTPGAVAAGGVAMTDDQAETKFERRANAWKSLQSVIGGADPAAQAMSDYQNTMERLRDVVRVEKQIAEDTGEGFSSIFTDAVLRATDRAAAKLQRDISEAINPIGKEIRLTEQANDVTAMRVAGLSQEADWKERLNELSEQGYDTDLMKDEATWTKYLNDLKASGVDIDMEALKMSPAEWAASRRRTDNLQLELDLVDSLNAAKVASVSRTGSAYDQTVMGLVQRAAKPGESIDQAMARLSTPDSKGVVGMDLIQQQAGVLEGSRRDDVRYAQEGNVNELLATKGMKGSKLNWRSDYKAVLKEITGSQSEFLGDIEKSATDADKAWATYVANVRYAAENPPGFQKWVDGLQPFAERLQDIKAEFVSELSGGITDAIMGEDVDWTGILKNAQKKIIGAQVDGLLAGGINIMNGKTAQGEASTGSIWERMGTIFGGPAAGPQDPAQAQAQAAGQLNGAGITLTQAAAMQMQAAQVLVASAGGGMTAGGAGINVGGMMAGLMPAASNDNAASMAGVNGMLSDLTAVAGGATAGSSIGAGAGGLMSGLASFLGVGKVNTTGAGMGSTDGSGGIQNGAQAMGSWASALGSLSKVGGTAGGSSGGGSNWMGAVMAAVPALIAAFSGGGDDKKKKPFQPKDVPGVIGEARPVDISGKATAAHANKTGQMISSIVGIIGSFFGAGSFAMGTANTSGMAPQTMAVNAASFAGAPHYAQGTANTSGIPAIVHPDEAIIPLSGGRKVPVEMKDNGSRQGPSVYNSNVTIVANDPNTFRSSEASLRRRQMQEIKRASLRNLN